MFFDSDRGDGLCTARVDAEAVDVFDEGGGCGEGLEDGTCADLDLFAREFNVGI